jgi:CBS-domain-containing membrane protein
MTPLHETPQFNIENIALQSVLQTVEDGQMGVAMAIDAQYAFKGLVSSADIRKALLKQLSNGLDLNELPVSNLINTKPICIQEDATVLELLQLIKNSPFAVLYLPVVDSAMKLKGIVQFSNLIKAEI